MHEGIYVIYGKMKKVSHPLKAKIKQCPPFRRIEQFPAIQANQTISRHSGGKWARSSKL